MTALIFAAVFSIWPFASAQIKEEIETFHNDAKSHIKTDRDSAIALVQLALTKSEEASYSIGIAKSHAMLASAANKNEKSALATTHFLKALQVYETLDDPESKAVQAKICLTMGKIFWQHHKYQSAIDFYEQGVGLSLSGNNHQLLVKLLHNAAVAYRSANDFGSAIKTLTSKLEYINPKNTDEKLHTYNELGLSYQCMKEYQKAQYWFQKMISEETKTQPSFFRGQAWHNLANIYKEKGNYPEAQRYFERALSEREAVQDVDELFITYQDMASLALLENQPERALTYASKATPLLELVPNTPKYFDQYKLLASCYETLDVEKSQIYFKTYGKKHEEFDEIQEDLIAQIEGYKLDLVLANHEKQLLQSAQQKKLTYTVIMLLILCLVTYVYMDYRKRRYRLKLIDHVNFFINNNELIKKL